MTKYVEFGYGVMPKEYTEKELEDAVLYNPDDILSKLYFHKVICQRFLHKDGEKSVVSYETCVFANKDSFDIEETDDQTSYTLKSDDAIIDNLFSLRLKLIRASDGTNVDFHPSYSNSIICDLEAFKQALDTLGYNSMDVNFEDISFIIANLLDTCTIDVNHKKQFARIRRSIVK